MSERRNPTGSFEPSTSQFALPRGVGGWIAGRLMNRTNRQMCQWAAELLELEPQEQILEIGFGTGMLVEMLTKAAPAGLIAGVDPSAVMLREAARRNRGALASGRAALHTGTASSLPFADGSFDKVCALNSFQFWQAPAADLREVRRVLKPGGLLLLGLRLRNPGNRFTGKIGFTPEQVEQVRSMVESAGYADVRIEGRQANKERATYLLANARW